MINIPVQIIIEYGKIPFCTFDCPVCHVLSGDGNPISGKLFFQSGKWYSVDIFSIEYGYFKGRRMVMAKGTKYSQEFKEDAIRYRLEHSDIALRKCVENLGISESALKKWIRAAKEHEGSVPTRGSGNYASDEAKEIARLQRELRDTKDALEVLKKAIGILGK